jgi:hypothetical protein
MNIIGIINIFKELRKSFSNFEIIKVYALWGIEYNIIFEGEFVIYNILSYIIEEN